MNGDNEWNLFGIGVSAKGDMNMNIKLVFDTHLCIGKGTELRVSLG
jgi:hypothetical protein